MSYKKIACELKVSKSSVSSWCRDIILSQEHVKKLSENCRINSIIFGRRNKERWDKIKEEFLDNYNPPFENPRFMLGLGLYWGEGTKWSESTTEITNSDPKLLIKFIEWINEFFHECNKFGVQIHHYNPDNDVEIKKYWCEKLNLPIIFFNNSVFAVSRASQRKKGNILPNGTAHVRCAGKDIWRVKQKINKALKLVGSFR